MSSGKTARDERVSQKIKVGSIKSKGDVNITQNALVGNFKAPSNATEFAEQLGKLIQQLDDLSGIHPDVKDVQAELRSVVKEIEKPNPEPSAIRKLMNKAKGLLEGAAEIATPLVPLVKAISELIKQAPTIFGN